MITFIDLKFEALNSTPMAMGVEFIQRKDCFA